LPKSRLRQRDKESLRKRLKLSVKKLLLLKQLPKKQEITFPLEP
jgi:hypothetical protein